MGLACNCITAFEALPLRWSGGDGLRPVRPCQRPGGDGQKSGASPAETDRLRACLWETETTPLGFEVPAPACVPGGTRGGGA